MNESLPGGRIAEVVCNSLFVGSKNIEMTHPDCRPCEGVFGSPQFCVARS